MGAAISLGCTYVALFALYSSVEPGHRPRSHDLPRRHTNIRKSISRNKILRICSLHIGLENWQSVLVTAIGTPLFTTVDSPSLTSIVTIVAANPTLLPQSSKHTHPDARVAVPIAIVSAVFVLFSVLAFVFWRKSRGKGSSYKYEL